MTDKDQTQIEALKTDLNVRLEEFKALRTEIVSTLTASYSTLNLSLTAAALLVPAAATLTSYGKPYWMGVASLVFYALLWTQLRYGYAVFNMSNHIIEKVAPSIRTRVQELGLPADDTLTPALCWESSGRRQTHPREFWLIAIETARFAVPLLAAAFVAFCYFFVIAVFGTFPFERIVDSCILVLNLGLFAFSTWACLRLRSLLGSNPEGHNTLPPASREP